MPKVSKRYKVLLLSGPTAENATLLQEILTQHVEFVTATNLAEMLFLLEGQGRAGPPAKRSASMVPFQSERTASADYDAFLCDCNFEDGTWRSALELVQRWTPYLPTIVVCRTGGEREWIQVLDAGAFDMIGAPFSELEVLSVLEHAAASRETQALRGVA